MLDKECVVVGEDVIATKPDCEVFKKIGQIYKVRIKGDQYRISVIFDGNVYNFDLEDLVLA